MFRRQFRGCIPLIGMECKRLKKTKLHRVIIICGCAFLLFISAGIWAGIPPEQKQVFDNLVARYMEYFNSRNSDGILSMYADDARIKTEKNGKDIFVTKEEYKAQLPGDIKEWNKKKLKLVDFKIEELEVKGGEAIVEIEFRGKQGIFSGRRKGNIELKKLGSDWKIARDEF